MIIREKNNVVFPVCTDFVTVTDFITEEFVYGISRKGKY